jgi:hypothetical protein
MNKDQTEEEAPPIPPSERRLTLGLKPRNPRISENDPWIRKHSWIISPRKVHAIGVLALEWNGVEQALIRLACAVCRIEMDLAWVIFSDHGDIKLIEKIRSMSTIKSTPQVIVDLMEIHFKYYDQTRINRNVLIHNVGTLGRGGMQIRRTTKRYNQTEKVLQSVGHVRRCADYTKNLANLLARMAIYLDIFYKHGDFVASSGEPLPPLVTPPPPEILWKSGQRMVKRQNRKH